MQLLIQIQLEQPLTLPINYNHILQGIVYHAIGSTELAAFVHDTGYQSEERSYKLFQFSQLNGHYRIRDKQITFDDMVWFEVRSLDPQLVLQVKESIDPQGVTFYTKKYTRVRTQLRDETVEAERIIAVMQTPITVHDTDPDTKKTIYYSPNDARFRELVADNFARKYKAYTGVEPEEPIVMEAGAFDERDKCVTKYKGFYICGWKGSYILRGQRKYLDFLYQAGLGDRNSQGFGMFDVEDVGEN